MVNCTLAAAAATIVSLTGCASEETFTQRDRPRPTATASPGAEQRVRPARCPRALANCRTATGRVLYVEAVDPDGDGDAHYVLAGGDITGPGLSVVDVARDLRPQRLPKPGDLVSAAGPVYSGSYGQRQIQAITVNYGRR